MSEVSSYIPDAAASTSSCSSVGPPEWTCAGCSADGAAIELIQVDGNMVCPQCATIDTCATSARGHVDISTINGQIVEKTQTLQTLQNTWNDRASWNDRTFMAHVDTVLASHVSEIVGNSSFNLLNGSRLWFNDLRKAEHLDGGWKTMSTHTKTPKLVVQIALAVRMASQEMNLISMYNKLQGKKPESSKAVRGYTKGDDRVPVLGFHEYFDLNQQLPSSSPGRISNFKYWRQATLRYEGLLGYKLSPCDFFMSLTHRVIAHLQSLVQASPEGRRSLLLGTPPKPKPVWPDQVLDDLKQTRDWDEVFRTVHGLWQAQNCVSLFANDIPAVPASAAVTLTVMACEAIVGEAVKSNNLALESELCHRLRVGITSCKHRRAEVDRFVLSWSTSISELGLPVPSVKPSNRSMMLGAGNSGWGSDKRRGVPKKVIMPLATLMVAKHWREIKKARLARPGILHIDEECALARRLFAGKDIAKELAESLAKSADPLLPSNDIDWGSDTDTESESSFASPSEVGFYGYSGDYGAYVNPKYAPTETSIGPVTRRFWRNASTSQSPAPAPPRALGVERFQSIINKPDMIQAWIENGDASSSEEGDSSEDGAGNDDTPEPTAKRARHTADTSHIGELPQPFAFSIGKEGFSVEKTQSQTLPTPAATPAAASSSSVSSRAQSVVSVNSEDVDPALKSLPMARQLSATPSAGSATSSIARRPAPLRATLTPAPATFTNGALPSARAEREAIRRGRRHLSDHTGVLIREKKQYFQIGKTFETVRHAVQVAADIDVVKSMDLWLERQKQSGSIAETALVRKRDPELRTLIKTNIGRQSPIETLLRAGVGSKQIPHHLLPRSVCATNMDLFHYADRDAILGVGEVEETERLLDLSLRLFFRGFGNDTLPEVFLNPDEMKERIASYHLKGHWDVLADSSPVPKPKFRKRKREVVQPPDNMIQRIASEYVRGPASPQEEEDVIQQAVLAGLLVTKALHPWDPYKVSATVPALWYLDDLFELGLVDTSKLGPQEAWETAEITWARRRKNEERGEVDMPMPEGLGAVYMAKKGLVMIDGVVTKRSNPTA